MVGVAALVPTAAASAMVQVGAAPSGVPGSSVQAVVQNQSSGTGSWIITAPPSTVITAAQSIPGPGLLPFTCVPINGGAQADCQFSGLWGADNQVAITMTIDPTAAAPQTVTGNSTIQNVESGDYSVDIVPPAAPAAPAITAPPAGDESIVTQPTITGSKTAGAATTTGTTLTATLDGDPLCTVAASTESTWACAPAAPLAVGTHTISATQTDRFGQTSPAATTTFTVLAEAGLAITQTGGTPLYAGFPAVHTVTVRNAGDGEARGVVFTADTGGLQVPVCELDGAAFDCATLTSGVQLGTMASGGERVFRLTIAAPAGTVPGTSFPIATRASSSTDPDSPVDSSSTLVTSAPTAPVITAPANGSSTVARRVGVFGNGVLPGATVAVRQGDTVLCTATGMASTGFSCTPDRTFPLGAVTLTATQTVGGIESDAGSTRFTVRAPATPPGGTTPLPGTGGGSTGGSGGTAPGGSGSDGSGGTGAGGGSGSGNGTGSGASGGSASGDAGQPPSSAPATPSTPSAPAPAPAPGAANGSGDGSGDGNGGGDGVNNGPMAMNLRFGTQRIVPGTASDMRGTLGPNASGATVAITFQARMSTGMVYRNVNVEVDDQPLDCTVATTSFSCMIPLDPGQQADVDVRVYADPVNAPDTAVQQISLASNRASQANAITVTTAVAKGETEASQLADQITTFNVTEFPGAMVPLLAMLLFALAATVAGRRAASGPAAGATTSPTGSGPPEPSRASSPTSPRPTTDPPSGSNR
ncbi:Ig-like domain-containing protein [Curtobacterium pusillum]|uniref:Ig-like domain-containing protein n=1 Tax=Curtobacterium pusillum TaxID=69373 RepID=UPI0011A10D24|nr:Ig-like domain-containing protein [Curtobacterium pusillum]